MQMEDGEWVTGDEALTYRKSNEGRGCFVWEHIRWRDCGVVDDKTLQLL